MRKFLILLFVGLVIPGLMGISYLQSQVIQDPEAEYLRIRTVAFSGDFETAAVDARKLVNAFPSYGDARILLGRILAWQKDYEQAAAVIDTLLITEPDNADAVTARRDISLWSKENTAVLTDVRTGYSFDYFNKPWSRFWQVFKAGMGHRFSWGPGSASINAGNLISGSDVNDNVTELQFEADAYPRFSDNNYAYISYAYSSGIYFPNHRAALEIWQVLPNAFAISGGMNYYKFKNDTRNIIIALASVEKYLGKYWLSGKCYVYFKEGGPRSSFYINTRRYFNDFDYLQLTLGTGTAPDEPYGIREDINRLSANSVRLAYNFNVKGKFTVRMGTGYSREEYDSDATTDLRNRFEGNINLIYALKMK
jgi:YaiO family outer membrane protein